MIFIDRIITLIKIGTRSSSLSTDQGLMAVSRNGNLSTRIRYLIFNLDPKSESHLYFRCREVPNFYSELMTGIQVLSCELSGLFLYSTFIGYF